MPSHTEAIGHHQNVVCRLEVWWLCNKHMISVRLLFYVIVISLYEARCSCCELYCVQKIDCSSLVHFHNSALLPGWGCGWVFCKVQSAGILQGKPHYWNLVISLSWSRRVTLSVSHICYMQNIKLCPQAVKIILVVFMCLCCTYLTNNETIALGMYFDLSLLHLQNCGQWCM